MEQIDVERIQSSLCNMNENIKASNKSATRKPSAEAIFGVATQQLAQINNRSTQCSIEKCEALEARAPLRRHHAREAANACAFAS